MSDLNDIFATGPAGEETGGKLPEALLMAYLEGTLPVEKQREVELWLAEEGMESDAVEGLKNMHPTETTNIVQRLNHNLRKELAAKKRKRRPMKDHWNWLAILIVLLLAIAGYVVIHLAIKK